MAQDLSIENCKHVYFITTRTVGSRLWFVNNPVLELLICAFLAKYQRRYGVVLYGFILMGNHYHLIAAFPNGNKAQFLRAFNSIIARLTASRVRSFEGKVWARRARCQVLPLPSDVEHWFLYASLNPVSSGLGRKLSEYPAYNAFSDAILGRVRKFKLVNWQDYQNRKRYNVALTKAECTTIYELRYSRLPGYESLSQNAYRELMLKKAETRRQELIKARVEAGLGFATRELLLATEPGAYPKTTKTSNRDSFRPLVLTLCREARKQFLAFYFQTLHTFKEASLRYRAGDFTAVFPPGTYRPVVPVTS